MVTTRTATGQFLKGHCPNPKGRPRAAPDLPVVPSPVWAAILAIANEIVPVEIEGRQRRVRMTRFEASVLALGSGRPHSRSGLLAFIRLVRLAAQVDQQLANPPKRWPADPEDFEELEAAAASGSYEQWQPAIERFTARLPGIEEMSDRQLVKALEKVRKGETVKWPPALEERITALLEVLNRPK